MPEINFEELYENHSRHLYHIAFRITKDRYLAEDVVQETFIKAYKKMDTIESTEKIGAWLAAIAGRTAIDSFRAEKRKRWVPSDHMFIEQIYTHSDINESTEKEVDLILFKEQIHQNFLKLTDEYQQVLILRVGHGLKEHEIASQLNLKAGTVKTRLHRARKQLKKVMVEKFPA